MPSVSLNFKNVPKGKKLEVAGLGTFENGTKTEVDQATWNRFKLNRPNYGGPEDIVLGDTVVGQDNTVEELKQKASAVGVEGYSNMRKDELVAAIEEASN